MLQAAYSLAADSPVVSAGVAFVVIGASYLLLGRGSSSGGRNPKKPKNNSDDVVLFTLPRWQFGPNPSGPCLKAETFLRLAKIPYSVDQSAATGPTERWPYMSHRGEYYCDSNTIMEYCQKTILQEKGQEFGDSKLSARDKALGDMITRALDDGLYYGVLRSRWEYNFSDLKKYFRFDGLPNVVKTLILNKLRSDIIKTLNSQGCGDRTKEEFEGDILRDVKAVEQWLPMDGKFFGNQNLPTTYDCTLYAHLTSLSDFPYEEESARLGKVPAFATYVRENARIQCYIKFVERRAFPDMEALKKETNNGVRYNPQ